MQRQQAKQQRRSLSSTAPLTDRKLPDRPTVKEVARWLRKSINTIYQWAREGEIPCKKVGRSYIFDKAALLKWARPEETA